MMKQVHHLLYCEHMKTFFTRGRIILLIGILLLGYGAYAYLTRDVTPDWITETVTRGEVAQIVSVSGVIKAENTATLTFPTSGIVSEVLVKDGDAVVKDQILARLQQAELAADRTDALSAVRIAQANHDELIRGRLTEAKEVTAITVEIARENLARTKREESEKVASARRTLLSNDLEALPTDLKNSDIPPTISGAYSCATQGAYTLKMFSSGAQSGSSYQLSGLENGSYSAYTDTPAPLGTCGLRIQFDADESYASKGWIIEIPNTRSTTYTTLANTYTLAEQQETNAVEAAAQALEKALREQTLENATPREEALARAKATILQAEARLAVIDARINDRILRAPFDGTISDVAITVGETVSSASLMTVVAQDIFELTVRIPEIDITKILIGQLAEVVFDARPTETVTARVDFVAVTATLIDGVAYFEAKLRFDNPPEWFRSGLNSDVDIIIEKQSDVIRIPKRFLITDGTDYSVLVPDGTLSKTQSVQVSFIGNDGFVVIEGGLSEGDTVIAP
jgi:HlyD family secretion protein